jgi:hypothetical protein
MASPSSDHTAHAVVAVAGADGVEKQPHIDCAAEVANGAQGSMWARLEEILLAGHLLGAAYKPKYAGVGGVSDAVAMPVKEGLKRVLIYPILEMSIVEGQVSTLAPLQ